MSLKAKIRNIAKLKSVSAQVVLQNFMIESFLERLSKSSYRDRFILKGGVLIASLVGIENRTTMDMDTSLKNYPLHADSIINAIHEICRIIIDDGVSFSFTGIDAIHEDDVYGGYRVSIIAKFETIVTPLQLDITAGDALTPMEILYEFKMTFKEGSFSVWAYNVETVLAEKVETILRRGELNTRPRDFYDVYILTETQSFKYALIVNALKTTSAHRKTTHILINLSKRLDQIGGSEVLGYRWLRYTQDYPYADGITFDDVLDALRKLLKNL